MAINSLLSFLLPIAIALTACPPHGGGGWLVVYFSICKREEMSPQCLDRGKLNGESVLEIFIDQLNLVPGKRLHSACSSLFKWKIHPTKEISRFLEEIPIEKWFLLLRAVSSVRSFVRGAVWQQNFAKSPSN